MKEFFNLVTNLTTITLIEEEVLLFDKINPEIITTFKDIVIKINNSSIIFLQKKALSITEKDNVLSFTDNSAKNFYPLDYKYMWSSYSFLSSYLKYSNFQYSKEAFVKLNLARNRMQKMGKLNSFLKKTPFYITRKWNKNSSFPKWLPSICLKDAGYYEDFHFRSNYCCYYPKSAKFDTKYEYVIQRLSDEASKIEYKTSIHGSIEECWKQYFGKINCMTQYNDYISLDQNSIVINCGVENGMELKLFNGVREIYNIDPGGDRYLDKSVSYMMKDSPTKINFIESVLYENTDVYTLTEDKTESIQVTTIKEVIDKIKIDRLDLIKTDIEGAERFMCDDLIDACNRFKTQLAISIYHTNHAREFNEQLYDLVDIPSKLIDALSETYDFYMKRYSYERWELIFYAIPKNK